MCLTEASAPAGVDNRKYRGRRVDGELRAGAHVYRRGSNVKTSRSLAVSHRENHIDPVGLETSPVRVACAPRADVSRRYALLLLSHYFQKFPVQHQSAVKASPGEDSHPKRFRVLSPTTENKPLGLWRLKASLRVMPLNHLIVALQQVNMSRPWRRIVGKSGLAGGV